MFDHSEIVDYLLEEVNIYLRFAKKQLGHDCESVQCIHTQQVLSRGDVPYDYSILRWPSRKIVKETSW